MIFYSEQGPSPLRGAPSRHISSEPTEIKGFLASGTPSPWVCVCLQTVNVPPKSIQIRGWAALDDSELFSLRAEFDRRVLKYTFG